MRKRVAIPIYSFGPGGAERVVSILLEELGKRYDITLVLMNDNIFYRIPPGVDIYFLERSRPFEAGIIKLLKLPWLAWKYRRFCKRKKIDLTLSFMNRPNYIAVLAKLLGLGHPVIISERGTPGSYYDDASAYSVVSRFLICKLYPLSDMIVCNSYGARWDLNRNFGIELSRIEVIYNPFDLKRIEKMAAERYPRDDESFVWVSVGRLDRKKNFEEMIELFSLAAGKEDSLWIIGEGIDRERIAKKIEECGVSGRVKLLGRKENPFRYLAAADIFLFASTTEGFPNVLVEALACSLPVVSSDCLSGPREILGFSSDYDIVLEEVKKVEYAILFPAGEKEMMREAMEEARRDSQWREKMRSVAARRARDFDKGEIVKHFEELIERFIHE